MRRAPRAIAALLFVCLASVVPGAALAQQQPPKPAPKPAPAPAKPKPKKPKKPRPPIFLTLGVSGQVIGNTVTQTLTFSQYGETATVKGPVTFAHSPHIDVAFGVQLKKRFSMGAGMSFYQGTGHLDATFSIPHPLVFNANRTASGSAQAHRSNFNIDVELSAMLASGKAWRLDVVGGPTISHTSQQLATDSLTYLETYPYDTIVIEPSDTSTGHSAFGFGVHAGMRMARQFNRRTGLTIGVRWRYSTFRPDVAGTAQGLNSSGLLVGAGIRFVF